MIGIPAGQRSVVRYKIIALSFTDKPSELHCFGYKGGDRYDWVWSTAIQMGTVTKVQERMDSVSYRFTTKSGSEYVVSNYDESPITYPSEECLTDWFRADSMRILTEQEWKEIVK